VVAIDSACRSRPREAGRPRLRLGEDIPARPGPARFARAAARVSLPRSSRLPRGSFVGADYGFGGAGVRHTHGINLEPR
jgi:hypothetical protein